MKQKKIKAIVTLSLDMDRLGKEEFRIKVWNILKDLGEVERVVIE